MGRTSCVPPIALVMLMLLPLPSMARQIPTVPPPPVPVGPPDGPGSMPVIPVPQSGDPFLPPPGPFAGPGPPPFGIQPPPPPPLIPAGPPVAEAGYYGLFEIAVLFPQIHGQLTGNVPVTGMPPATVSLGGANLNTTGSPLVEVGYRLGDGLGAVAVSYRNVASQGGFNTPTGALGYAFLETRLNVNVVDIDYVSPAYNMAPFWDFSWRAGLRTAAAYYDNMASNSLGNYQATNNFIGAGPHAEVEIGRALELVPGLAVLAKLDGAFLVGNDSQSFSEALFSGTTIGGAARYNHAETMPMAAFDFGLTYTPPCGPNWARFGLGYRLEYWWDVGTSGASHGDLGLNGLYFRGEFNF